MNKALVVARWEFLTTVTRVPYIFAVVALPLFYGGMIAMAGFAGQSAAASNSRTPAALVDTAHIVDLPFAAEQTAERDRPQPSPAQDVLSMAARRSPVAAAMVNEMMAPTLPLVSYPDQQSALDALRARTVNAVYVIAADYMKSGAITSYARQGNMFGQQADRQRQTQLADAIRAGMLKSTESSNADFVSRAFGPTAHISRIRLNSAGQFEPAEDSGLGAFAGSFGLSMLLTMSIFMSAGYLQQATLADRTNRMIEILFSSIKPDDLVLGKLLGLGGAGVLQILIYLGLVILPGAALFSIIQVSAAKLALAAVFFVIGFLTFACLMIGTGMLGRTAQEGAQLSAIWMLLASTPWFFITNIGTAPNGAIARTLSFIPLTSSTTMVFRILNAEISPLEVALAIATDTIAIYLIFKGASRIFRASALMYGKRANLPELMRWLRAA